MKEIRSLVGPIEVQPVPIPHDCTDGFMGAYWRRPAAYLQPDVRRAISAFARISDVNPVSNNSALISRTEPGMPCTAISQWRQRWTWDIESWWHDLAKTMP